MSRFRGLVRLMMMRRHVWGLAMCAALSVGCNSKMDLFTEDPDGGGAADAVAPVLDAGDAKPKDAAPGPPDAMPADADPVVLDAEATDADPVVLDAEPTDAEPVILDAEPTDAEPTDGEPVVLDAEPADADPVILDAEPLDAVPAPDAPAPDAAEPPEPPLAIEYGDNQTAFLNQALPLPVVIRAVVVATQQPLARAPITVTAPTGAVATLTSTLTDAQGRASISLRVGLLPGGYDFDITVGGTTVTVHASAVEPPRGTIFTLVNAPRRSGTISGPTPGSVAPLMRPDGIALDSNGTLYFTERGWGACGIFALSPAGVVSRVAGTGVCGTGQGNRRADDSVGVPGTLPALAAPLGSPRGLAIDVARRRLYVSEPGGLAPRYQRGFVKMLNLNTGLLSAIVGGGPVNRNATQWPVAPTTPVAPLTFDLAAPGAGSLSVAPDGRLFIADGYRWLALDPALQSLSFWSHPQANDEFYATFGAWEYEGYDALIGGLRFDSTGTPVLSGYIAAGGTHYNLVRGPRSAFVGLVGGGTSTADGPGTQQRTMSASNSIAIDPLDRVSYSEQLGHVIRRYDPATGLVTTLAGDREPGWNGDYGPATAARVYAPGEILLTPDGHLIFVDTGNAAIRVIW